MDMNKRGGMELSMSTIVVIVIAIIILIFGIIFGRNIMCSGIRATDQIDTAVKNQLRDLFGSDKIGVSCQGEEGSEVKLATGKRVSLVCQIKVEEAKRYKFVIDKLQISLGNDKFKSIPGGWILKSGADNVGVKPGSITYQPILFLNVPRDAAKSTVFVDIRIYNLDSDTPSDFELHTAVFDLVPLNFIQTTMC